MTARDLLLEIGVEELPASFVAAALDALPRLATELLGQARLGHGTLRALGTPRRLALLASDVAERQADLDEEVVGPPRSVAMDAKGKLTRAGEGFVKKQGARPEDVTLVRTDKGEYMAVRRRASGGSALEVLPELLGQLCARVPFAKSMRWGAGDVAFGRPVHWLVALHGAEVVPVTFAGVRAGRVSRGHRFLAPGPIQVRDAGSYVDALRAAKVRVDPEERRRGMLEALERTAAGLGGRLVEDAFLVDENLGLVEEPHVVPGGFDEAFLALPEEVIVSVMRGHQRYFALRDAQSGRLLPGYVNVVNTALDPERIRLGNDRVLRARLSDARFFVEEDQKVSLEARVPRLDTVVFQNKLGSIGDKVRRVRELAEALARQAGVDPAAASRAAQLCKADLVSLIVGEFPELQGEMGRWYALREGVPQPVADAIRDHYLPKGAEDRVASQPLAAVVAVADRLDTLVGCFGVGLTPSGSADPFALRRAALGVVRTALEGPIDVDLAGALRTAHAFHAGNNQVQPIEQLLPELLEFFRARLRAFHAGRYPGDLIEACLGAWPGRSLRDLDARLKALEAFRARPEFEALAVAFKRSYNIAGGAPSGAVHPELLREPAERELAACFASLRPQIESAIEQGAYGDALTLVARDLRKPIDGFFEQVFVMVDDLELRANRLRLLEAIASTLTRIAHFHVLTTPG